MSDALEEIVTTLGHEPKIVDRPRHRPGVDLGHIPGTAHPVTGAREIPTWTQPTAAPEDGLALRYSFDDDVPFAFDLSGAGLHGIVKQAKRVDGKLGKALRFSQKSVVVLPSGSTLLGAQPSEGTLAVWVRPGFNPSDLPAGLWEGYHVILYLMKTDGNGLPDGYDEIGLYVHGDRLFARCAGLEGAFCSVPSPLRRGQWTHLCLTWTATERRLYANGKVLGSRKRAFPLPKLDDFRGCLGSHPPQHRWAWNGELDELRIYRRCLGPEEGARLGK